MFGTYFLWGNLTFWCSNHTRLPNKLLPQSPLFHFRIVCCSFGSWYLKGGHISTPNWVTFLKGWSTTHFLGFSNNMFGTYFLRGKSPFSILFHTRLPNMLLGGPSFSFSVFLYSYRTKMCVRGWASQVYLEKPHYMFGTYYLLVKPLFFLKMTRLCLICSTPPLFHLTYSFSVRDNIFITQHFTWLGVTSPKQALIWHLKYTLFCEPFLNLKFDSKLWWKWDLAILLTKQALLDHISLGKRPLFDLLTLSMGKYRWMSPFLRIVCFTREKGPF